MLELAHFNNGWITPVLAYAISVIGSVLGLRCAAHARDSRWPAGWLIAAAVALGGCGIWVMHFTAMLGFAITDATIRYDVPMTALSAAIAIVVVWIGLSIAVRVRRELIALPIGGTITGLGVATMHYLGMYAMHSSAHMEYRTPLVALSIVIAVVAATAALWFMLHVRGFRATLGAALIMGLAVCGMHYTGMASMRAHAMDAPATGVDPMQLIGPLILIVTMVTMMLIVLVGLAELDDRSDFDLPSRPADPDHEAPNWPRTTDPTRRPGTGGGGYSGNAAISSR
ncbi:MHYT domain-containing protein [Nocardia crassostreae]|uniref:MHYT domain-containing protein n=1 Tax=Nocardia crassostreae TaxID=53428 RepID=UPI00082E8255|nr:MHYT domain-containing protein [Nocardia crassostreae]